MARDIDKRLQQLHTRRRGIDRLIRLNEDARSDVLARSLNDESWQSRTSTAKPYTRYALGAMQEVGPDYTRISVETAERVGKQLRTGLEAVGISVDFRLQGSVPLNVHIRGVSDVDLLNLDTSYRTYAAAGRRSLAGLYTNPTSRTSIQVLSNLRSESERILKDKYASATVNTSGGKAINISGGSLARPVDVVPSHWHDTIDYQASGEESDRVVKILNTKVPETLDNLPFLHIKRVHERDAKTLGGLKKSIRLCKNVKSDAESDGKTINLPSFDIAAIMYHADLAALLTGAVYELGILAETQRYLDWATTNESEAVKLLVPDGSRPILDTRAKLDGLRTLSVEMDDLAREVAKEQGLSPVLGEPSLSESRTKLHSTYIPG